MSSHLQELQTRLRAYLTGRVKFALLFGSVLTDYFRSDSDVDLAVYLGRPLPPQERLDFKHELEKALGFEYEFDVVFLDTADPIIAMQALANGEVIVQEDFDAFIKYKARMISQYIDFKRDRKIIEDRLGEGSVYD